MKIAGKALSAVLSLVTVFAVVFSITVIQPHTSAAVTGKTAMEIISKMGAGWSLGNTLDANSAYDLSAETSWGNPKTTKAMIEAVKKQGFNTVRIPVSWGTHKDSNNKIDAAWMARVKEVVDYCFDYNMYVILNIHHDTNTNCYYPSSQYEAQSVKYISDVWRQISEEFKDYDQHLIFETMNEPRLVGTSDEWWFPVNYPNSNVTDSIEMINKLNQTAVDTIRSCGGYNSDRCIMVPGYCASIDGCTTPKFKLPTDTVSDRLIVSVHAYTPYDFALNANGTDKFEDYRKSEVDYIIDTVKSKFIDKGIAAVIGETSASNKNNAAERIKWAHYYFSEASTAGIPCVLWDNNVYTGSSDKGEQHGHLNRRTLQWYDKEFADVIISYYPVEEEAEDIKVNKVSGLKIAGRTDTALRISWDKNSASDGYIVEQYKNGKWSNIAKLKSDVTSYRIDSLSPFTEYKFRVQCYKNLENEVIKSEYSEISTYTCPDAVANLKFIGRTDNALRLSWSKNTVASGYIVEQYKSGKWVRIAKLGADTTNYKVGGLSAFTEYKFRVQCFTNVGSGALKSGYKTISTYTCPDAVANLKFIGRTDNALRLSWSKNPVASGYIVEQYKSGKWVRVAKLGADTTNYRVGGLSAFTEYKFRVQCFTNVGSGALKSSYEKISTYTCPDAVANLKVAEKASNTLTLSWDKKPVASGYIVEQYNGGKWVRIAKLGANSTSYKASGLSASTEYKFRVQCFTNVGSGALKSEYKYVNGKTNR